MAKTHKGRRPANIENADSLPDTLASDPAIRNAFGFSAATLTRKRQLSGFPVPDFYIDRRGYTWWSRIVEWTKQQPKTSPIAGRMVGHEGKGPADDFREAS